MVTPAESGDTRGETPKIRSLRCLLPRSPRDDGGLKNARAVVSTGLGRDASDPASSAETARAEGGVADDPETRSGGLNKAVALFASGLIRQVRPLRPFKTSLGVEGVSEED